MAGALHFDLASRRGTDILKHFLPSFGEVKVTV
jgi:hypothetical protein